METVTPALLQGKNVLLRYDFDVPIKDNKILEDFRLRRGLTTLRMCWENAKSVTLMGHVGRPNGEDPNFSVAPIVEWLEKKFPELDLPKGKLHILENLRFEQGEDQASLDYAKKLSKFGDFFVNEAFAAHHKAASTILLPTLLPHAAGLNFAHEVEILTSLRQNPDRPFIAIIGGAKLEDKLPVVETLAKIADAVIVGGKLPSEIKQKGLTFPSNVLVAKMDSAGTDLDPEVIEAFTEVIHPAKEVIWAGPVGYYEAGCNKGNIALAEAILKSGAKSIIGGGDTIAALDKLGFLQKFYFVSTGGGAMLKFLIEGTLPTIEVLK